ncbi:hypothetical protein ASF60_06660 [Methylobacterium sp. Leaf113]|uniref:hypothetical protein n=1 Tax=Methylobacterium sp. Leaf113 TaxID=1736259 RepID=UPI0006F53A6F|nr:hypothetical protein [Methylobacterium sp. Leaf113]KQP77768.1 hypothetical protein ASF60_06660 [Methylobacterium sp. Leaf113]
MSLLTNASGLPVGVTSRPAEVLLERSVADALRIIAAACAERNAAPVKAARRQLAEVYGATRLSRRRERQGASA